MCGITANVSGNYNSSIIAHKILQNPEPCIHYIWSPTVHRTCLS
ncbi:unnamed protein product [Staurois parvus]|uniref:Uncharacterized protein n=1 Tax=Staurois parvus TaxID=386267 RepID=A0ABN9BPI5_9NEOB|nr:unnamed protein product [Staurois parvus]